jgi:DNA-binding XRE family transcriptional regulator
VGPYAAQTKGIGDGVKRLNSMAARIDYRKLIDDFVLDDRRVGDRSDIHVSIHIGSLEAVNQEANAGVKAWGVSLGGRRMQSFLTSGGAASLECHSGKPFTPDQERLLSLLGTLVRYFELTDQDRRVYRIFGEISRELKEIRESLGVSQAEIANHIKTSRIAVSRWESAAQPPGNLAVYRWCQALGLICPPAKDETHRHRHVLVCYGCCCGDRRLLSRL